MPSMFGGDNMSDDYAPWTKSNEEVRKSTSPIVEINGVRYGVPQSTIDACYAHPMRIMRVGPHLIRVHFQWAESGPVTIGSWDLIDVPGESK